MFFLAPFIFNALLGIALSFASTLIAQIFAQDKRQTQAGVRGSVQLGGDNPLAFIMGRYATGGQLDYAGTWGEDGDTPNAFYTKVVSVSDLPVRGLAGLYVNGERVTILPSGGLPRGAPVDQYRIDGKDHLWVKFYDGTQTAPDAFLLAKFGSDPDRPWQPDMIGRGVAYVVVTALVNRELFSSLPDYLIEVDGIPLNDRRGGSAQHENPIVGIDHILGGVVFDGQWVYGPQSISTARRPLATWRTQMDKCDVIVDGDKAFRFGYEVRVDQEPHVVIGEYLKACQGRIAEIGGIYKPLVGGPDSPVVSFTDEDIVITAGQSYEPFPGLEATFNGITATYPEPAEAWENKEAPPRYRGDLEVEDDNRRLPFSTSYVAVPYPVQVQRLMRAAIEETRRFRRHVHTMPPEWWEYEPLDAVVWNSERNGYVGKVFLITAQDDLGNGNQIPALQEQDPSDYDWTSDYKLPWNVVPLVISRPDAQIVTGWAVTPEIIYDAEGNARRPAVRFSWDGEVDDVRAVGYQLRIKATLDLIFDDSTDNVKAGSIVVASAAILPNQVLQGRGIYHPFSGRRTDWTEWLDVTTFDIRLSEFDLYPSDFDPEEYKKYVEELIEWAGDGTRDAIEAIQQTAITTVDQDAGKFIDIQRSKRELTSEIEGAKARFTEEITVATGPDSAIAQVIATVAAELPGKASAEAVNALTVQVLQNAGGLTSLISQYNALSVSLGNKANASVVQAIEARVQSVEGVNVSQSELINEVSAKANDVSAQATFRMFAEGGIAGGWSRIAAQVRAGTGSGYTVAGFYLDAKSNGESRVTLLADKVVIQTYGGGTAALFAGDTTFLNNARIRELDAGNIRAKSIDANVILQNGTTITELIANNAISGSDISVKVDRSEASANQQVNLHNFAFSASGNRMAVTGRVVCYTSGGGYGGWLRLKEGSTIREQVYIRVDDVPRSQFQITHLTSARNAGWWLDFQADNFGAVGGTARVYFEFATIEYTNLKR